MGKVKFKVVPSAEFKPPASSMPLLTTLLPVAVKPLPVMVTGMPMGPEFGDRLLITGALDEFAAVMLNGAALLAKTPPSFDSSCSKYCPAKIVHGLRPSLLSLKPLAIPATVRYIPPSFREWKP